MPPLPKQHPESIHHILSGGIPLLDVRAPAEYTQGHIPNSVNVPILEDDERRQVGIAYKNSGQAHATELGHQLVSGTIKKQRIDRWLTYAQQHPDAYLTCWRGGARSSIAQRWLAEQGCTLPKVPGGYKALRNHCISVLQQAPQLNKQWWVLAGRTGSGKTVLIQQLSQSIDLEALANHRGSAFGAQSAPQPSLASFENHLAQHFLQLSGGHLVVEDESRMIGRIALPQNWHSHMQTAPLVMVEVDIDVRVAHIKQEYIDAPQALGQTNLADHYQQALSRISRRLGGLRHQRISQQVDAAFQGKASHEAWIHQLLTDYYDPMYDYQLAHKQQRIVFSGGPEAVLTYLQTKTAD